MALLNTRFRTVAMDAIPNRESNRLFLLHEAKKMCYILCQMIDFLSK